MDAAYIEFPFDVEKEFSKKGQVKIRMNIEGFIYRGSLVKMGSPCHFVGVPKKIREKINKNPGDKVNVEIAQDLDVRKVKVPEDVQRKLKIKPKLLKYFQSLSYTHQREYIEWIEEAKKPETRQRRVEKMLMLLKNNIKEPR